MLIIMIMIIIINIFTGRKIIMKINREEIINNLKMLMLMMK